MRKLIQLAVFASLIISGAAHAELKIAVLDVQMALMESDAAKKYEAQDEKKFGAQFEKIKTLESDTIKLQQRLQKDGEKMQQAEYERLELDYKQKVREVQIKSQEFNEARAKAEQEFLQSIKPKLDKAIEEVLKSGNYDLVIDRAAAVDVSPKLDITLRVVERLNQMR